jgi:outer membrane protein TolC
VLQACVVLLAAALSAPSSAPPPADSACVLPFERYYATVAAHHPVVRQARLLAEQARADLLAARGAWDPSMTATLSSKTFGGKEYYDYAEAALRIPTPLGADLKLGYERNVGEYASDDIRTPRRGLVTAGLSIPLGQRIATDERRAALRQARALVDVADADRRALVNKLLLDAAKDYARWYEAWRRLDVARGGVSLAAFRLGAVRGRVAAGEAAAVDTVEARLEVQRREVALLEADAAWFAATLAVSAHLWDARGMPVPLPDGTRPSAEGLRAEPIDPADVPEWLALALRRHPDLLKNAGKIRAQEALRLLAAQRLIPFAELSLASLADRDEAGEVAAPSSDDVKTGLVVRSPLLFMRERGALGGYSSKLEAERVERDRLRREVELEVRTAANELLVLDRLLVLQRDAIAQARALRDAEQRRFDAGESSLLVVNLRERLVLDEELKLAALEAKYAGARAGLAVALGEPGVLPR